MWSIYIERVKQIHQSETTTTTTTKIQPLFERTDKHLQRYDADRTNWNDVYIGVAKILTLENTASRQCVQLPAEISPYHPEYMLHKQSHSENVHIWSCFAANRIGEYEFVY
jgi:hypothetical protein